MDDETGDNLSLDSVKEEDFNPLSPIVEMDESIQGEERHTDLEEDLRKTSKLEVKLNLETSVENIEERSSQPQTPPEILRVRLNSLQNDYEELKEFTDLERQTYHSDCIPRDEVKYLEEEFESLKEKVQQLMLENSEYQKKLEAKETELQQVTSEIAKVKRLQNESIIEIEKMKKKLQENTKEDSTAIQRIEFSPPSSLQKTCSYNIEDLLFQGAEQLLNSLLDLDNLVESTSNEKIKLQDKVEYLLLEVTKLNGKTESMNHDVIDYQQNLAEVKSNCVNLKEKLANVDKELTNISLALSVSEEKCIQVTHERDIANNLTCKLQKEMDNVEEQISFVSTSLESFVNSLLYDDDIKSFLTQEDLTSFENNLRNTNDLSGISSTLDSIQQIFHKLKVEFKMKQKECCELHSKIKHIASHLRKCEEDVSKQNIEIENFAHEVNEHIPSRLKELEDCLGSKISEILRLQNNLDAANAKVDDMSNKLSDSKVKLDQMRVSMDRIYLENTNLETEILKLKERLTVDDIKTDITLAVKCLDNVLDSWDEKSHLKDLINAFQEAVDFPKVTNLLMNLNTEAIFNKVALKCKKKLLTHEEKTNLLFNSLKSMTSDIDRLENENKNIRLEVNALDHIVKQGISDRVNKLEKLVSCSDQGQQNSHSNDKCESSLIADEVRQKEDLNPLKTTYDKLQKQINNLNKATKPDDCIEKITYVINEIQNLINSWDCSDIKQLMDFIQLLHDKMLPYCASNQTSEIKNDIRCILNKLQEKIMGLFELNNQMLKAVKSFDDCVNEDDLNKQEENNCHIQDLLWKNNNLALKGISASDSCEKEIECSRAKEIKKIKKLMCLEITSLDGNENKESLMCDSVESIFSKLMQIIMVKEQEMSYSLQKQQKEEVHNFEQTIEKLNNKLKSQASWTNTLENENEKLNNELAALKTLNNSLDFKIKALYNDIDNMTLELDIVKKKMLEAMTENDSLISDLNSARDLINKNRHSISCLEKDNERLNEDAINKSNVIENLKSKLTSVLDTQKCLDNKIDISSTNSLLPNDKGNYVEVRTDRMFDTRFQNVRNEDGFGFLKDKHKPIPDNETGILEMLKKETAFIDNILRESRNVSFSELLSSCDSNIYILKDLIQNIRSKISEVEMNCFKDSQSIQTALEHKTKEMRDFKLRILTFCQDLSPQIKKKDIIDESFQQVSICSIQNEIDQIKSDFGNFSNRAEEVEESAKLGQNIVQNLREVIQTIVNENNNMSKLIHDLNETVESEQAKNYQLKGNVETITNENNVLKEKNLLLENKIKNLKLELSQLKRELFSELDISFPDKMQDKEKIMSINNTLKQYSETQKICYIVTEELRFFGYHCELMLSYIQSLEYRLYYTTQQKEILDKENTVLKSQLTAEHMEMNKFFNEIISKSPVAVKTQSQAVNLTTLTTIINNLFSQYKLLKENHLKHVNEDKPKQENIMYLQKELSSLTKQNSSLKFELAKCEDSIRNLRSELRITRTKCQRRESISVEYPDLKKEKMDASIQTDRTCCKKLQKQIIEQKEKLDILTEKLNKSEHCQRSTVTCNPYNKQVTHLEGALAQAKEKIRRLHFALKQQESHNQELVEALKVHESCQPR